MMQQKSLARLAPLLVVCLLPLQVALARPRATPSGTNAPMVPKGVLRVAPPGRRLGIKIRPISGASVARAATPAGPRVVSAFQSRLDSRLCKPGGSRHRTESALS